jgi:hypothetical protein
MLCLTPMNLIARAPTTGREGARRGSHSVRCYPGASRQGIFKSASKAPRSYRLSAAVSVCGKGPAFAVEAALTRLSAVSVVSAMVPRYGAVRARISDRARLLMNGQTPNPPSGPLALRKTLSFEQAEGLEHLPRQLRLKDLSEELRAKLSSLFTKASTNTPSAQRMKAGLSSASRGAKYFV